MGNLFDIDGKACRFLEKAADGVLASILWMLFSIPVVTAGASATALYYSVQRTILQDTGNICREFWKAFRCNFRQATCLWGIFMLAGVFLGVDCYFAYIMSDIRPSLKWILLLLLALFLFLMMWSQYWFAYISHISDPLKTVLKNTLIMCILNFPKSLMLLAALSLCAAIVILMPLSPVFFLVLPGAYMYFASGILQKVFAQYWDMDCPAGQF